MNHFTNMRFENTQFKQFLTVTFFRGRNFNQNLLRCQYIAQNKQSTKYHIKIKQNIIKNTTLTQHFCLIIR